MEEIFSLPPLGAFDNNYQMLLEFMDTLGNPKFKIAGDVNLENSDIESLGNLVEVEGDLDLFGTKIKSLPNNLKVGGDLFLYNTPLSKMYSIYQIRKIIKDKGGYVKSRIYI